MAEDYGKWLEDLSRRTGASVEQSDLERLQQTNPDDPNNPANNDTTRLRQALESQYARRGASGQTGSGMGSEEATARGYGSGRGETAEDYIPSASRPSGGGGVPPMASWLGSGGGSAGGGGDSFNVNMPDYSKYFEQQNRALEQQNTYLGQMQEAARAREAQIAQRESAQQAQRDQLYGTLMGRAQQSTNINADDPVIRGQVEAFRNEQTRGKRDYLSDVAESAGSLANLRGEKRMAAERTGQATGGFQAQLLGRELSAKRAEIADALQSMGGMLSADQQANLTRELGNIDSQLRSVGTGFQGAGVGFGGAAAAGGLGLGFGRLGLDTELGRGALSNELQRALMQNQQFYSGLGSQQDQFLADLGLRAENQFNYWRDPLRGLR